MHLGATMAGSERFQVLAAKDCHLVGCLETSQRQGCLQDSTSAAVRGRSSPRSVLENLSEHGQTRAKSRLLVHWDHDDPPSSNKGLCHDGTP